MAKKKPPKKAPRRISRPRPKARPEEPAAIPDRRAIEGMMKGLLDDRAGGAEPSPLGEAQDLMYRAFESPSEEERVALARQALEVSPDCADAYVVLAEASRSRKETLELYKKGVEAGERALGPEAFREYEGHFWGYLETRPYMRARHGLANTLWMLGHREEAIAHLQEMLRLNPGDNQGVRYVVSGWLLAMDRDDELGRLLDAYDEDSATWAYSRALLAFRREGDTPEARQRLEDARKANPHVPAYLLGTETIPAEPPAYYSPGKPSEAILYAAGALAGWKGTPGAIAWLKESEKAKADRSKPKGKRARKTEPKGPLPKVKGRLQELPQSFDVWQADSREFGPRLERAGALVRPWITIVTSRSEDLVLAQAVSEERPSSGLVWDTLALAMRRPAAGEPHRPTELQVRPEWHLDDLRPPLEEIGVEVVPVEELDHIDFVLKSLNEHMSGEQPPGLLEMPGVRPEQVAGFFRAAAEFYRRAPWRKLGYESAIKVDCRKFQGGLVYAVVMGQSGLTFGLALYDDLNLLKRLWAGTLSEEENARRTVALTLTFDEPMALPDADLDAIENYDLELAGPEAYPSIFRKERGMSMRPPLAWELELMEGCLRALPDFVDRYPADDVSERPMTVETASGPLDMTLSWVDA